MNLDRISSLTKIKTALEALANASTPDYEWSYQANVIRVHLVKLSDPVVDARALAALEKIRPEALVLFRQELQNMRAREARRAR